MEKVFCVFAYGNLYYDDSLQEIFLDYHKAVDFCEKMNNIENNNITDYYVEEWKINKDGMPTIQED